jgi:flagellar biosynthesis protein FlhG
VLAIMLASAITRRGCGVLLVDATQNQGNLHILLGLRQRARLEHVLQGEAEPTDLLVPVTERLALLPADTGTDAIHGLTATDRARLHHRLTSLYHHYDAVVIDAGPGIDDVVRVATMRATRLVVVAVPEATSLSDAYALIKIVTLQLSAMPIEILVNRVRTPAEAEGTFQRLNLAAERFLRRQLEFAGGVAETAAVPRWQPTPADLLADAPQAIAALARRLAPEGGASHARPGD